MSRYLGRSSTSYNPQKKIPDALIEKFYVTLRTGEIEDINRFLNENKIDANIIQTKGDTDAEARKTPLHVVLELDSSIADDDDKVSLVKFLYQKGAPLDLPDSSNIRPIHLAAGQHNTAIINFLIEKGVSLKVKDRSDNTPLHYAIIGNITDCPNEFKSKPLPLIPNPPIEKQDLSKTLRSINQKLIGYITETSADKVGYIINTAYRMGDSHQGTEQDREIDEEILNSFTGITINPNYSGDMESHYNAVKGLIERTSARMLSESDYAMSPVMTDNGPDVKGEDMLLTTVNDVVQEMNRNLPVLDPNESPVGNLLETVNMMKATVDQGYLDELFVGPGKALTLKKTVMLMAINHRFQKSKKSILDIFQDIAKYIVRIKGITTEVVRIINENRKIPYGNPDFDNKEGLLSLTLRGALQHGIQEKIGGPSKEKMLKDMQIIIHRLDKGVDNETKLDYGIVRALFSRITKNKNTLGNIKTNGLDDDLLKDPMGKLLQDPDYESVAKKMFYPNIINPDKSFIENLKTMIGLGFIYEDSFDYFLRKYGIPFCDNKIKELPYITWQNITDMLNISSGIIVDRTIGTRGYDAYPSDKSIQMKSLKDFRPDMFDALFIRYRDDPHQNIDKKYLFTSLLLTFFFETYRYHKTVNIIRDSLNDVFLSVGKCFGSFDLFKRDPTDDDFWDAKEDIWRLSHNVSDFDLLAALGPSGLTLALGKEGFDSAFKAGLDQVWNQDHPMTQAFNKGNVNLAFESLVGDIVRAYRIYLNLHNNIFFSPRYFSDPDDPNDPDQFYQNDTIVNFLESIIGTDLENSVNAVVTALQPSEKDILDYIKNILAKKDVFIIPPNIQTPLINNKNDYFVKQYVNLYYSILNRLSQIERSLFEMEITVGKDICFYYEQEMFYIIPALLTPALVYFRTHLADMLAKFLEEQKKINKEINDTIVSETAEPNKEISHAKVDGHEGIEEHYKSFLQSTYRGLKKITEYHNKVHKAIDNKCSIEIVKNLVSATPQPLNNFFSTSLPVLEELPLYLEDIPSGTYSGKFYETYRWGKINYYNTKKTWYPLTCGMETNNRGVVMIRGDRPDYKFTYNMILPLIKSEGGFQPDFKNYEKNPDGTIKKLPDGTTDATFVVSVPNFFINIDRLIQIKDRKKPADDFADRFSTFNVMDAKSGKVFVLRSGEEEPIFGPALIGYITTGYDIATQGMPSFPEKVMGEFFKVLKVKILKEVLHEADGDADLLNEIKTLANFKPLDIDTPNRPFFIINNLAEKMVNSIIEYAINLGATQWVRSKFKSLPEMKTSWKEGTMDKFFIKIEKKFLKSASSFIEQTLLDTMEANNSLQNLVPPVEPSADLLEYTPLPKSSYPKDVIHYFIKTGTEKYAICYHIDLKNIIHIINTAPDLISMKNLDGNTPLHLAVQLRHPALVRALIDKQPKTANFVNNEMKTPLLMILSDLHEHLNVIEGYNESIYKAVVSFAEPFNAVLATKLEEGPIQNNILKRTTLGAPLSVIMYNHMFFLFMNNYRYGFTREIKNEFRAMMRRFLGNYPEENNPYDLFRQSNASILTIMRGDSKESFNEKNKGTSNMLTQMIKELDNQLNALGQERAATNDTAQVQFIQKLEVKLKKQRKELIKKQGTVHLTVDPVSTGLYERGLNKIIQELKQRTYDLTDFYKEAMSRISKGAYIQQNIFDAYLKKPFTEAPSMIFVHIHGLLGKHVDALMKGQTSPNAKEDLACIKKILNILHGYNDIMFTYPKSTDDNPNFHDQVNNAVYAVNLIITPAVADFIRTFLYDSFQKMDLTGIMTDNIQEVIEDIMTTEIYNGKTMISLLENEVATRFVKMGLDVYNSDSDPDRKYINQQDIFAPISSIINMNKFVALQKESPIFSDLDTKLYPFLGVSYNSFIDCYQMTYTTYEKYLSRSWQIVEVLDALLTH